MGKIDTLTKKQECPEGLVSLEVIIEDQKTPIRIAVSPALYEEITSGRFLVGSLSSIVLNKEEFSQLIKEIKHE